MPFKYADVDDEYAKNKSLKKQDVQHLQEWMEKQPHLPPLREIELIFFLRSCKYSIEQTKTTIDNYMTLKGATDTFIKIDLQRLETFMNGAYCIHLPKVTPQGHQVLYIKIFMSANDYVFVENVSYVDNLSKVFLIGRESVEGLICILDMEKYTFGHLTRVPLGSLKKYMMFMQEGLPIKLIGIHYINASSVVDKLFTLIKPLIKKELLDIMHVHSSDLTTLYPHVPRECLPKDLGGEERTVAELHEEQKQLVIDNVDSLIEDQERVADESKRQDKSRSINEMFGVTGSFKALEID